MLKPLINKEHIYERFLSANKWALSYMANGFIKRQVSVKTFFPASFYSFLSPFEKIIKQMQILYMRRHKTNEITTDTLIAFHRNDWLSYIKKELNKRQNRYKLA